jgi:hypothetical protein
MTWRACLLAPLVLLLAGRPEVSHGRNLALEGTNLLIRRLPSTNKLVFLSRDPAVDPGSADDAGDPRCSGEGGGGGAIRVNGGPGNDFTIILPCGGWTGSGTEYLPSYTYRDPTQTTCTLVIIRHAKFAKAICRGPQVAYVLGAPQGDIDVTLRTGSLPNRNCARFGPAPTRVLKDGSDGKTYHARGAPEAPSPCSSP